MIVVFAGSIGRFPVGGHAWVDLQYLLGFRELGCEVYYLEECGEGSWVYDWEAEKLTTDLAYPTSYLSSCLEPTGLGDRWIYRAGDASVGMDVREFREVCEAADLLLVRGCPLELWRDEYTAPRRKAFVDSDPGFTQFKLARRHSAMSATVDRCDRLFTVGGCVGSRTCSIPTVGREWIPMLPPVCLSAWPEAQHDDATHFTSVMQWRSYDEVTHEGTTYGNKNLEFPKFMDLPQRTKQPLRIAVTGLPPSRLSERGWDVVVGWKAVWSAEDYRQFVLRSRGEFGVAKHGYVSTRGGWVSDRTACYLAAGRPALVQDTGQGDWLPVGEGLLTFQTLEGAVQGIECINSDYSCHRAAARRLAEEHFSATRVLSSVLDASLI
jgi:hypothetical protein